ncbi:MAG: MmgE/PrpD family protein [Candidatus Nanopelagicales bacterium]
MSAAEDLIASVVVDGAPGGAPERELALAALCDTLAVGLAGLPEHAPTAVRSVLPATGDGVRAWNGHQRYSVADVALLHGTACHALDWDDYMHPMHGHCSSVLLPAVWGLAEHLHRSGAEAVEAYLVGYQVDYLASLVLSHGHYARGWHATSTIGVLGAAAAASRLMRLDLDEATAALGIAASSASGLQASFGTPTKALHAGLAARAGVLAAQLAAAGMTASRSWLVGRHGMLQAYGGDTAPSDAAQVVRESLDVHGITTPMGLVQKPYTSCGCSHAAVDAVVGITGDVAPDDIARIEVHVDPAVTRTMRETIVSDSFDSRYSPSWVVAVAASDGTAGPAQFSPASISRAEVLALRERVDVTADLPTSEHDRFAARVVVHLRDGSARAREVRHAQGHPANPFDAAARELKQRTALSLVLDDVDAALDAVRTAWAADDLADAGAALRGIR